MNVDITQARKSAAIVDATAAPVVVSPGDNVYFKVKLHPYRGVDEVTTMSFTVPKDQPLEMCIRARDNTCINVLEWQDGTWRLVLLNSTNHMGYLFSGIEQKGL